MMAGGVNFGSIMTTALRLEAVVLAREPAILHLKTGPNGAGKHRARHLGLGKQISRTTKGRSFCQRRAALQTLRALAPPFQATTRAHERAIVLRNTILYLPSSFLRSD